MYSKNWWQYKKCVQGINIYEQKDWYIYIQYTYIHTYIYTAREKEIYVYIYIYRERERERIGRGSKNNKRFILVLWKNNIQMIGFPIGPSSTIQKQKIYIAHSIHTGRSEKYCSNRNFGMT